jgi:hypothetical protein
MSKQLAFASMLSVLMMGAFALFGPHNHSDPFGGAAYAATAQASSD